MTSWPALLTLTFVLGLLVGSFLNVVIYRVPRGESIIRPGSHCPACGRPIRAWHNLPVLGWLVLRGRCADCRAPIGVRYPLVELGTGLLFVTVTVRLDELHLLSALPAFLYFAAVGLALAVIDVDTRRLPNAIVLPSYPVVAAALAFSAAWQHDWWSLARAAIGGVALYAFFFVLAFAYPAGMGFGDVKLAGIVGGILAYLSWPTLIVGSFAGFLFGALFGIAIMVVARGGRKTAVPFGPFMMVGAFAAILFADAVAEFYVDTVLSL